MSTLPNPLPPEGPESLAATRPLDAASPTPPSAPASVPAPAPAPAATEKPALPEKPVPAPRRTVRVGSIVWGFVVVACGVVALAVAGGASVDGEVLTIGLLGGAGVALVLGSVLSAVRRRR
ncbi:hypothetical protein [Luteimicrobium subarcticum]|uniref:Uncharacterized protein n=1 Tax=Luteimicrobium subarcticum TaxID=620910 RepID=A0A2M8WV88_9MICO|nr:hypothetical protein [Luteimicrobium subarcticum]PJI94837.1 hypothetical protein CLV34_0685 [Luteimicrobium subarcticum]